MSLSGLLKKSFHNVYHNNTFRGQLRWILNGSSLNIDDTLYTQYYSNPNDCRPELPEKIIKGEIKSKRRQKRAIDVFAKSKNPDYRIALVDIIESPFIEDDETKEYARQAIEKSPLEYIWRDINNIKGDSAYLPGGYLSKIVRHIKPNVARQLISSAVSRKEFYKVEPTLKSEHIKEENGKIIVDAAIEYYENGVPQWFLDQIQNQKIRDYAIKKIRQRGDKNV